MNLNSKSNMFGLISGADAAGAMHHTITSGPSDEEPSSPADADAVRSFVLWLRLCRMTGVLEKLRAPGADLTAALAGWAYDGIRPPAHGTPESMREFAKCRGWGELLVLYDLQSDTVELHVRPDDTVLILPLEQAIMAFDQAEAIGYGIGTKPGLLRRVWRSPWKAISVAMDSEDPEAALKHLADRDVCRDFWLDSREQTPHSRFLTAHLATGTRKATLTIQLPKAGRAYLAMPFHKNVALRWRPMEGVPANRKAVRDWLSEHRDWLLGDGFPLFEAVPFLSCIRADGYGPIRMLAYGHARRVIENCRAKSIPGIDLDLGDLSSMATPDPYPTEWYGEPDRALFMVREKTGATRMASFSEYEKRICTELDAGTSAECLLKDLLNETEEILCPGMDAWFFPPMYRAAQRAEVIPSSGGNGLSVFHNGGELPLDGSVRFFATSEAALKDYCSRSGRDAVLTSVWQCFRLPALSARNPLLAARVDELLEDNAFIEDIERRTVPAGWAAVPAVFRDGEFGIFAGPTGGMGPAVDPDTIRRLMDRAAQLPIAAAICRI